MNLLTEKDTKSLLNKVNDLLSDYPARVVISNASEKLIAFYEERGHLIKGQVVIVRTKKDYPYAANLRNECEKVLFIFSEYHWPDTYFSGTSQNIKIPKALIKRVNSSNIKTIGARKVLQLMDQSENGQAMYLSFVDQVSDELGIEKYQLITELSPYI